MINSLLHCGFLEKNQNLKIGRNFLIGNKKKIKSFKKFSINNLKNNLEFKKNSNQDTDAKDKFLSWLSYNNVYIFNKSTWGRAPHQCFVSNETTDEGEPCGRGLLAFKKIQQGEKLIEIPENLILSVDRDQIKNEGNDFLNEYDSLGIFLIQQMAMGDKSKWKIYFDILPREEDLNLGFRWNLNDIVFLRGSKTLNASLYLKEKIKIQFLRLEKTIFSKNRLKYPVSIFNLAQWEWALSILLSRAIFLQNLKKVSLVPYADFMNHNPFSTSYINSKKISFSKNHEIVMYADKDYNKFDQIFTTYGQKTNLELLLLYGFILERNPFDSIELRISLSDKDSFFEKKKQFMIECEKTSEITFPIFYYKYPKELYEFLRFCISNQEELGSTDLSDFNFNDENNYEIEKIIRKLVLFSCEKLLKNYSKKVSEEKILNSLNSNFLISKNQKMALKQSKCEKKIIQRLRNNL
ncbi:met (nucleomorph) [Hemiselmis andersenii]|uniref:Met n=1 Tax=Hemiselmis andersenii TaxID=464988 RepID=A9BK89_HEMAN|nr:met [Hemiselmis andersenii]ABW97922.1 met [Hemiselmis andersenii]|mmetsp:Transcript_53862/g.130392  ORF Transcript_53862/g.130392 Transcript_53862/m.130392 type:complete len:465 (+) Transcript_53862:34-1428(+)